MAWTRRSLAPARAASCRDECRSRAPGSSAGHCPIESGSAPPSVVRPRQRQKARIDTEHRPIAARFLSHPCNRPARPSTCSAGTESPPGRLPVPRPLSFRGCDPPTTRTRCARSSTAATKSRRCTAHPAPPAESLPGRDRIAGSDAYAADRESWQSSGGCRAAARREKAAASRPIHTGTGRSAARFRRSCWDSPQHRPSSPCSREDKRRPGTSFLHEQTSPAWPQSSPAPAPRTPP